MSELTDAIEAGLLGGGIGWLWVRVERMNRRVKRDLEACEDARNTQLIVIELFWRALEGGIDPHPFLSRARELLDDLRHRAGVRQAKKE
jgi:hypothetical protein